jgi:hypothetical protein
MKNLRDFWSIEDEKEWLKSVMQRFDDLYHNRMDVTDEDKLLMRQFPYRDVGQAAIDWDLNGRDVVFIEKYLTGLELRTVGFDGESAFTDEDYSNMLQFCMDLLYKKEETWKELVPQEEVINVEPTI